MQTTSDYDNGQKFSALVCNGNHDAVANSLILNNGNYTYYDGRTGTTHPGFVAGLVGSLFGVDLSQVQ